PVYFTVLRPPPPRRLPSFPTRRSSDLTRPARRRMGRRTKRRGGGTRRCTEAQRRLTGHYGVEGRRVGLERLRWRVSVFLQREGRSEEHTSELQSREKLVCRLLLEKKKQ